MNIRELIVILQSRGAKRCPSAATGSRRPREATRPELSRLWLCCLPVMTPGRRQHPRHPESDASLGGRPNGPTSSTCPGSREEVQELGHGGPVVGTGKRAGNP